MELDINDAWDLFQIVSHSEIFRIKTGERRNIGKVNRKREEDEIYYGPGASEIDSHADTHCFGRNFRPLSWTGQECSVAPFLAEYSEQVNIPICTGTTAYTLETGETVILVFGQGLWFGNRMEKSLINPYQCRSYGISLCDDPTDEYRSLGIAADNITFVPLEMTGSTCGFITRYPTDEELESCRHITLSDEHDWDPSKDHFQVSSMQAKQFTTNLSSRSICTVSGHAP